MVWSTWAVILIVSFLQTWIMIVYVCSLSRMVVLLIFSNTCLKYSVSSVNRNVPFSVNWSCDPVPHVWWLVNAKSISKTLLWYSFISAFLKREKKECWNILIFDQFSSSTGLSITGFSVCFILLCLAFDLFLWVMETYSSSINKLKNFKNEPPETGMWLFGWRFERHNLLCIDRSTQSSSTDEGTGSGGEETCPVSGATLLTPMTLVTTPQVTWTPPMFTCCLFLIGSYILSMISSCF